MPHCRVHFGAERGSRTVPLRSMQWGPGWGRRLHRGKHGGQPGGGAAQPDDVGNENSPSRPVEEQEGHAALVEALEQQLRDLHESMSFLRRTALLEAGQAFEIEGVLAGAALKLEAQLHVAKGVQHSMNRLRAEGIDEIETARNPSDEDSRDPPAAMRAPPHPDVGRARECRPLVEELAGDGDLAVPKSGDRGAPVFELAGDDLAVPKAGEGRAPVEELAGGEERCGSPKRGQQEAAQQEKRRGSPKRGQRKPALEEERCGAPKRDS